MYVYIYIYIYIVMLPPPAKPTLAESTPQSYTQPRIKKSLESRSKNPRVEKGEFHPSKMRLGSGRTPIFPDSCYPL